VPDKDGYVRVNGAKLKMDPIPPEWKPARLHEKFEIGLPEIGDGKSLVRLLGVKGKIESSAGSDGVALWEAGWETERIATGALPQPLPDGWSDALGKRLDTDDPALSLKNGRLTTAIKPRQAVTVEQIVRLPWSKKVRSHWLFEKMWVVPLIRDGDERATLSTLARAVGGKLVEDEAEWRIHFDPSAFRKRAITTVRSWTPKDSRDALAVSHYRMAVEVWNWIDDSTLLDLYRKPWVGGGMPVKRGTPLYAAISQYAAAYRQRAINPAPEYAEEARSDRELLSRIDWYGEPTALFGQNLGVSGGYPAIGGGTVMLT